MKLLLIDNHDSFTYNLVQIIEEWGKCRLELVWPETLNANAIEEFDKVMISPGPGLPDEYGYFQSLFSRICSRIPILGVCLGHQALGVYFGAKLIHSREIFHGRFSEVQIIPSPNSEKQYSGVSSPFKAGRYHSWILDSDQFPECLEITATTPDGVIMSFCHKNYPVHGVQYHPESYMTPDGRRIIENWLEL